MKELMTTGAFAELCGTQKGTLLFYDREGLLKPKHISENGYRRYGIDQYFEYELLSILKDTGASLKDIKKYLHHMDGKEFLDFLEERYHVVKKELITLKKKKEKLQDMVMCMRESMAFNYDTLMIQQQEEEIFEVMSTGATSSETQEECIHRFIEYNEYIISQEEQPRYPFGFIVSLEDLRRDKYTETHYFNKKRKCTQKEDLYIKHAGMYAIMGHKGTQQSHENALKNMMHQIDSLGMSMKSDIYVYDMMSYVIRKDGDVYALKYCVAV